MKTTDDVDSASVEALVSEVTDEFMQRLDRGEEPDVDHYADRHPHIAGVLRQILPALQTLRLPVEEAITGTGAPGERPLGSLGDFRLVREVGRGGMGVVYEAEQISLNRRVALKVLPFASTLDAKQLQRFKNEAQAAASLHHTNIVPVFATGCERGVHYYAMQFIEGQSLAEVTADFRLQNADLKTKKEAATQPAITGDSNLQSTICNLKSSTLPSTQGRAFYHAVARLGIQAAEALDYSHELGIIHRDIKPANMLVDGRGKLWITDFGLAHCQSQAGLTMTGDLVGTLRYMSPEQALAKRVLVDHRTDIYSLGATLYELLTGTPVFNGADRQELLRQIAFEEPEPLRRHKPAIPVELETIVLKALEKNPADRYPTAKELAEDLERFTRDEPIRARRPSLRRLVRGWCRRHRTLVAASLAIVLTAVLLAGAALWRYELQSAGTARAVNDDVDETVRLLGQERWADAHKVLERARARLEGSGPAPLRQEVEKRQRELKLVDQLEKARWQAVAVSWREFQDHVGADRAYREAFADKGLDVTALRQEEVVRLINASAIKSHLVRALDDWAFHRDHLPEGGEPLRAIAQLVDKDPWREKLRNRQLRKDRAALVELAGNDGVLTQPPENLLHLSVLLLDESAPDAALTLLLKAQRVYPADFWINYELARLLGDDPARAAEAVAFGRAALALRPESPVVYLNLANALGHQGLDKEPEAEALCRKAIALQPDYAVAYVHLAANQLNQKNFAEAEAAFRKAAQLQPTAVFLRRLASFYYEQNKLPEAEELYRKTAVLAEDQVEKTKAKFGAGHRETTRQRALTADALYNLGVLHMQQRKLAEALELYRKAIELRPNYPQVYVNIGYILNEQGKLADAEVAYRKSIDIHPFVEAYRGLGDVLLRQQQPADAAIAFGKGIKLVPRADLYNKLGDALHEVGKLPEATTAYSKARELEKDDGGEAARVNLPKIEREAWRALWATVEELVPPPPRGFIRKWLILSELVAYEGKDGAKALEAHQIRGEPLLKPRAGDPVEVGGKTLFWEEHHSAAHIDFEAMHLPPSEHKLAYAVCYVYAEADRTDLTLRVGSDDQAIIYLNGTEVYRNTSARALKLDEDARPITLRKGTNVLVFKVVNQEGPGPFGSIHLVTKDGGAPEGIEYRLTP
jgi:serine/threonine protein kinase/cytochrome c-type biogenesis protein CcmH/NrfG